MYVIGLDVGTTGTKAVLVDESGKTAGCGYAGYPLFTSGNRVEQKPEDWWEAACTAVRQACGGISAEEISALSVSAQGATMAALDENGEVIGKAVTWLDTRAVSQTEFLREKLGEDYVYQATGWKLSPSLDAAKILYLKEQDGFRRAKHFLSTLEYLNFKLTGRMVIDPTCAGIRQLYHVKNGRWDERILAAVGCTEEELPELLPTGAPVGMLTARAAEALGLGEQVTVYNGAHDQYCASLGSGAVHSGDMLISTGTAWAVMGITEAPLFSQSHIACCAHPVEGLYGNMVSLTGAGNAYQWMKDKFFEELSFSQLDGECFRRIGKARDLIFLPWLSGNLYPYFLSGAKGGFLGADLSCDRYDFALSVMESAAFSVRAAVEDFEAQGCSVDSLTIMGGAAKSRVWMDIVASVMEKPLYKLQVADVCALGAAAIALVRQGCFSSYREAARAMVRREPVNGAPSNRTYYGEKYQQYRRTLDYAAGFYGEQN